MIAGVRGVVRTDRSVAYRLGRWRLSPRSVMGDRPMALDADVLYANPLWSVMASEFELCLEMGPNAWWCWMAAVQHRNGKLTANVSGEPRIVERV